MATNPLEQLRDIHLGDPIGAWPLAYGWYILIALTIIALTLLITFTCRFIKNRRPKKLALKELKRIEINYLSNADPHKTAYQITVLLKRVCFAYYPRKKIASLHGDVWFDFLGKSPWAYTLSQLSYQKEITQDLSAIFPKVRQWIKTCNKRIKHV